MTWIQTYSGRVMRLDNPKPEVVCVQDIAHSLGALARFNGHTRRFYSVAQHSIEVCKLLEKHNPATQLWGLLHDAHEAYIGDITRPVKMMLNADANAVDWLARDLDIVIETALVPEAAGIIDEHAIKQADLVMLATERRDLMNPEATPWPVLEDIQPRTEIIKETWDPFVAELLFVDRYRSIMYGLGL